MAQQGTGQVVRGVPDPAAQDVEAPWAEYEEGHVLWVPPEAHAPVLKPKLQKELVENIQCIRVACCCVTMLVIFVLSMMIWIVVNQQVAEVDSVATPAFVDASVHEGDLADSSVVTRKTIDDAVRPRHIPSNGVSEPDMATEVITTPYLQDVSVVNSRLAPLAVSAARLDLFAVLNSHMSDSSIPTVKINQNNVDSSDIADGDVMNKHFANNVVRSIHIVDNAVTTQKLADGSMLSNSMDIRNGFSVKAGVFYVDSDTQSTNKDTGAAVVSAGGAGIELDMSVGGSLDAGTIEVKKNATISNTTVVGNVFAGVGVRSAQGITGDDLAAASAMAGGTISAAGHIITSGNVQATNGDVRSGANLHCGGEGKLTGMIESTSTTRAVPGATLDGAITTAGGVAIALTLRVGEGINITDALSCTNMDCNGNATANQGLVAGVATFQKGFSVGSAGQIIAGGRVAVYRFMTVTDQATMNKNVTVMSTSDATSATDSGASISTAGGLAVSINLVIGQTLDCAARLIPTSTLQTPGNLVVTTGPTALNSNSTFHSTAAVTGAFAGDATSMASVTVNAAAPATDLEMLLTGTTDSSVIVSGSNNGARGAVIFNATAGSIQVTSAGIIESEADFKPESWLGSFSSLRLSSAQNSFAYSDNPGGATLDTDISTSTRLMIRILEDSNPTTFASTVVFPTCTSGKVLFLWNQDLESSLQGSYGSHSWTVGPGVMQPFMCMPTGSWIPLGQY